ncbi:hypothetical protein D3C87_945080 [compost metagenome]
MIPHGIIERKITFDVKAMLFFHVLHRTYHRTFFFNKRQLLVDHLIDLHSLVAAVLNGYPFTDQWDPIVDGIMYFHFNSG